MTNWHFFQTLMTQLMGLLNTAGDGNLVTYATLATLQAAWATYSTANRDNDADSAR